VSSRAGLLRIIKDESLKKKFANPDATVQDIVNLLDEFVK
jgi:hypothetical protein